MGSPDQRPPSRSGLERVLLFGTAGICLLVAASVLLNDLVWDDNFLIEHGRGLGNLGELPRALSVPFWHNSNYINWTHPSYWRPLTTFVLWLGAFFWDRWPAGFHLLSLLAACGATTVFATLLGRLLPAERRQIAWWIALVFLAHPVCAEVLSMAANVSDHLAFTFTGLAVLAFHTELGRPSRRGLLLAAGAVLLACCSKEIGVLAAGAPLAAWLLRRVAPPEGRVGTLRRPAIWVASVAPALLYLGVRYAVSVTSDNPSYFPPVGEYFWVTFLSLGQLFRTAIAPTPTGAHSHVPTGAFAPIAISVISWCATAGLLAWHLVRRRGATLPLIGLLFTFALLLPSMLAPDRVSDGSLRLATRFFHLPMVGLLIAALPLVDRLWYRGLRWVMPVLICLLALLSFLRIAEWRNDVAFFEAESRYHPESALDLINYARALSHVRAYDEVEKVLLRYEQLPTADDPMIRSKALNDWAALAMLRDDDPARATELLEEALKLDPRNMANVLDLAGIRNAAGHPEQAAVIIRKALAAPWFQDHRQRALREKLEHYEGRAAGRAPAPR